VFSNIEAIQPANIALFNALQARQNENPLITCLADIFLNHVRTQSSSSSSSLPMVD
jgi:hypothetical protein